MKKLTLQWRITLLTALILAGSTTALTLLAMWNADSSFMVLIEPSTDTTLNDFSIQSDAVMMPFQTAKTRFNLHSILACVLITLLGAVMAYFIAGKALAPLTDLSRAVNAINENTLDQRLPQTTAQDEIGVLTTRFNAMLERLDDAFVRQKRFTANAAHELKTPLATMKTGIQVLAMDTNACLEDYRSQATHTLTAINRLNSTVDDMLLLATAGANVTHERVPIWLAPLYDSIIEELEPLLATRSIHCHINCDAASIIGQPAFIARAFSNLVENACKYGYWGGNIWLTATQTQEGVVASIRDDGPGIAPEHLPYLFDAFYRVDKSRSRDMGGAGLGLSLVKTLIEADGGHISVQSSSSGTCFTVTFPKYSQ